MPSKTFESTLSIKEIEENFKNTDLFSEMVEGLQEAVEYAKGASSKETLVRKRSLPTVNVSKIRRSLDMTQKTFAALLGVSSRTVEAWESGKSNPTPTAKKLMHLIEEDRSLVLKLT